MVKEGTKLREGDYIMKALDIIAELKKNNVVPKLVEDQLRLIGETKNLSEEFIDRIKSSKGELVSFLADSIDRSSASPIPAVPEQNDYPVSNAQKRVWVLSQFDGAAVAYNIIRSFYLKGTVRKEHLNSAFRASIRRHESLRTVFKEVNGEPRQVIVEEMPFELEFTDIRHYPDAGSYLATAEGESVDWRFDLEKGPLVRVRLFQLAKDEYAMIFGIHHIISDGWSIGVLVKEVMHFYESFCKGQPGDIAPLNIHYKDYTHWLAGRIDGVRGRNASGFWKSQFPTGDEPLNLPTDLARTDIPSFEGAVAKYYLDAALYSRILEFSRQGQVTVFNFFRSCLCILLGKFSGQHTITIGTPVSGRNHFDLEGQIGLYVNTLPLTIDIDWRLPFLEFIKQVSDNSLRAFEYQDYPFDRIVEDLQVRRDAGRNPLFDVMMVLQNSAMGSEDAGMYQQYGFEMSLLDNYLYRASGRPDNGPTEREDKKMPAKLDLNFNFDSEPGYKNYLEIEYSTALYRKDRINQLFNAWLQIIMQVLDQPGKAIGHIEIAGQMERNRVLHEFNRPIGEIDADKITDLFRQSFERHGNAPAIIAGDQTVSYRELDERSECVAWHVSEIAEGRSNPFIGLLMERSERMVITILGVLKSGGAYVPIDTKYPAQRIDYIIKDAFLEYIIVDDTGLSLLPRSYTGRIIHVNDLNGQTKAETGKTSDREVWQEKTAYLIYTSGSTGEPKGVEICHRNTIAFLRWAEAEFAGTAFDIVYAATSYCFDLSIFEFFFPLMTGKTMRILHSAIEIPEFTGSDKKVMINTVPSVVKSLLDREMSWSHVTALNMAGEPVPGAIADALDLTGMEVRNLYGPTEDTTYSTVYRIREYGNPIIPIGVPAGFRQVYIMDEYCNLVPADVTGEIYISGHSVAKGYFRKPELTAASFPDNPFIPGMKMYKTGDIGRWLPDGNIEFSGRIDEQVKIRGYRVEPGEIRYILEQHDSVRQAVIITVARNNDHQLAAYWVGEDATDAAMLQAYLSLKLPAWLIPAYWHKLEEIPLNSNGKVDKKKLPPPVPGLFPAAEAVKPVTRSETELLEIWKEVLNVDKIGVTHNFFDLGGHSLKAVKLKAMVAKQLEKELTLSEIFGNPTIAKQARIIDAKATEKHIPVPKVPDQPDYPISIAQERLWVVMNFEEASKAYNMPAVFRVTGNPNLKILEAAFKSIIRRHEILRTVFAQKDGIPVQVVRGPETIEFAIEEITIGHALSKEEEQEYSRKLWQRPFDLVNGPLLSCVMLKSGHERLLSFNMHHLISDGWSVGLLYREVVEEYRKLIKGVTEEGSFPELQYRDFAVWQRTRLHGEGFGGHRAFWMDMFSGDIPVPELPADFRRPEIKTYDGAVFSHQFDAASSLRLDRLSRQSGVSLFMTLITGVAVLIKKYASQNDIVIGTPVAGRDHRQLQDQIGFYVNTLAIRTKIDPDGSFESLLIRQKEIILKSFEFQEFPLEMLIAELNIKRDLSRSPLFDVLVVLQNAEAPDAGNRMQVTEDLEFERLPVSGGIAKYECSFAFAETAAGLSLEIEYNTNLFLEETIARMSKHLSRLFNEVTADPAIKIRDISLLDEEEYKVLSSRCDRTDVTYDRTATIVSLFGRAVRDFSGKMALKVGERMMSYGELDRKSGQLANFLIRESGVLPGDLVILHFDRSEWMIISILAVLKAGGTYVPVDPTYPAGRIGYLIKDTGSRLVLYDVEPGDAIRQAHAGVHFVCIPKSNDGGGATCADDGSYADGTDDKGDGVLPAISPDSTAYVIYTSGTTGDPKGVLVDHRNVVRLFFNDDNLFDFGAADSWSLFHSYCFDFSVWEMYGALLNGGLLVIVPKETAQDSIAFYDFLQREKITVLNQTPSAFRSLVNHNHRRFSERALSVRYLVFGGEALRPELLREWHRHLPGCKNINMYGITETTVHVTYKEVTEKEIRDNKSNIGLPIPTLSCYVLDMDLRQVPVGVTGELCVGGAGVAKGYLNKPGLTAAKFVDDPFGKAGKPGAGEWGTGERGISKLYRSGDFARILPSGDIEYIGRKDEQVKIRGYRIEMGEVESAIAGLEGIRDSIVIPLKKTGDEYELAAYYISAKELNRQELFNELRIKLPAYMMPSCLIRLPVFPVNRNGKLDRDALPAPGEAFDRQAGHVASRNDIDRQIVAIWETVLERGPIGIRDNFFDLGGHSLKATRVISKLHETFGIKIDLKNLFIDPTIEHLSDYISTIQWMATGSGVVAAGDEEITF